MKRFIVTLLAASAALLADAAPPPPPDFTGVWGLYPDPNAGPNKQFVEEPPPAGGEPQLKEPYASAYKALLKRKKAAEESGTQLQDASARCLPQGMPMIMGAVYNIEFLQTPKEVVVLAEHLTQTRRIFLNEKMPPLDEITPSYSGYSVGHWKGDTLVVETWAVREDVAIEESIPHSRNMKITERLRLTGPGLLENRITIEDPDAFAKPYVFTLAYKRDPDYKILENICDNNRYQVDEKGNIRLDMNPH